MFIRVKGISLFDHEMNCNIHVKGCQYVDDSSTVNNNVYETDACIEIINEYGEASGSSLNMSKTTGKSNRIDDIEHNGIKITAGPEILLGIPVGKNANLNDFWDKKMNKVKDILTIWKQYDLSLMGKIYIIKSLGLSQIMYHVEMITISKNHVKTLSQHLNLY